MAKTELRYVGKSSLPSPVRHTCVVGWSGKGKGMWSEHFITGKVGKAKVIDFHSVERFEGFFYSIVNNNPIFKQRMRLITEDRIQPKAFKNDIIAICGRRLLDKNVKKLPANIKIRTLDKKHLVNEDLIDFLAETKAARGILHLVLYLNEGKTMGIDDMHKFLIKMIRKDLEPEQLEMTGGVNRASIATILRNIAGIKNSGIFSDAFPKIKIKDLVEDKSIITSISCFLLKTHSERALALGVLLRNINRYRETRTQRGNLFVYFRELQTVFKKEYYEQYRLLRDSLRDILEQGRDLKTVLIADFQSFEQVEVGFYTQFQRCFALGMTSRDSVKLHNFGTVPPLYLYKLQQCKPGQGMVLSNGEFRYLIEVVPTKHMKKTEGFPVLDYLGRMYGWTPIDVDYESIFGIKPLEIT